MYRPPGKDKTVFEQNNAAFIPKGAKNLPQTKFGILKLPKEGVFMVVTWLVTSQACSSWILKWAKDSELSRKTNHKKFFTTTGNYFCPERMESSII